MAFRWYNSQVLVPKRFSDVVFVASKTKHRIHRLSAYDKT